MIFKSDTITTFLVMTIILLLSKQIKLTKISDLILLSNLLILAIYVFDYTITLSILFILIDILFLRRAFYSYVKP